MQTISLIIVYINDTLLWSYSGYIDFFKNFTCYFSLLLKMDAKQFKIIHVAPMMFLLGNFDLEGQHLDLKASNPWQWLWSGWPLGALQCRGGSPPSSLLFGAGVQSGRAGELLRPLRHIWENCIFSCILSPSLSPPGSHGSPTGLSETGVLRMRRQR